MSYHDIEMERREAESLLDRLRRKQEREHLLEQLGDALILAAGLLGFVFMIWGIVAIQLLWRT